MAAPAVQGTANVTANGSLMTYLGNAPTGIVAGEILIAHVFVRLSSTGNSITRPTGWNVVDEYQTGGSGGQPLVYWKLASASEPASYTWTGTSTGSSWVTIFRISGADTTTPIDGTPQHALDASSVTIHTFSAVTTSGPDRLLLCLAASSVNLGAAATPWSGALVQIWYGNGGAGGTTHTTAGASEVLATAGGSGTRTLTTGSGSPMGLQSIAIAPPAATPAATPEVNQTFQPISFY